MRLHRFFVENDFSRQPLIIADKELYNQIKNVLRLRVGSEIVLVNVKSEEAHALIIGLAKNGVEVKLLSVSMNASEPKRQVVLYCAILKNEHFELATQKAVEVGVSEIVPILTARTVKTNLKEARLKKIMKEAAEQSGRGIIPKLHPTLELANAFVHTWQNQKNILLDKSGEDLSILLTEAKKNNQMQRLGIFIGPEGGFAPEEVEQARKAGFAIASLGSLILRAETAAIVTSYFVLHG